MAQARLWPVPSAPTILRAATAFLICAGALAACGDGPTAHVATPGAPSITSVVGTRFAVPVDLDHGGLLILPPRAGAEPTVTESAAHAMFEAADAVQGPHAYAIFGLGLVTVARRLEQPTTTTTTTTVPSPSSTAPVATTATATTTSSRTSLRRGDDGTIPAPARLTDDRQAAAVSTTTAPAPPSTTAVPPTTVPGAAIAPTTTVPGFRQRLAWVGIVWGATESCPGSTTTQASPSTMTSYVAIVIDARIDHRVIAYGSGGSSPCTGSIQAPAVTVPDELLSVPWQPVSPASTAVEIEIPPCGHYYGWTQLVAGGGVDDQVVVAVPFDPVCGAAEGQSQSIDQVVPLGTAHGLVGHAATGPVQALQALPVN